MSERHAAVADEGDVERGSASVENDHVAFTAEIGRDARSGDRGHGRAGIDQQNGRALDFIYVDHAALRSQEQNLTPKPASRMAAASPPR